MPKQNAPKTEPFTFRLPVEDKEWVESTARENGIEAAQVVRFALLAFKQYVDAHGGTIHLPIDIRRFWEESQLKRQSTESPARDKRGA